MTRYPPEWRDVLRAVADALAARPNLRGCSPLGESLAAEVLREVAEGRDPCRLFDGRVSTRERDWTADRVRATRARPDCGSWNQACEIVAHDTGRDPSTVRRLWRAWIDATLWPGAQLAEPDADR